MNSRRALLVTALFALGLPGCGESEPERRSGPDPTAQARIRAAEESRKAEARGELARARSLADEGKYDLARGALRNAVRLIGETTEVARLSEEIRGKEKAAREEIEYRQALQALAADSEAGDEAARLAALVRAKEAASAFLEAYPESEHTEEIRAGRDYAESELALNREYVGALDDAREHLRAGRHRECVGACNRALKIRDTDAARELKREALRALTPEGMVFIPAGYFLAGRDRGRTHLPAFYIDRTEVTNSRYREFVEATGHPPPPRFVEGAPRAGDEEKPVTGITLADALAYARWAKKRIPSELEWERAARGTDGRAYPWGEEWDPAKGHFGGGGTLPVGSRPFDRSPDGVMDMGGNVMEMTLPPADPAGETSGPVMRGGHWSDDFHPEYALTFARYPVGREHQDAASGFRCVRSAE